MKALYWILGIIVVAIIVVLAVLGSQGKLGDMGVSTTGEQKSQKETTNQNTSEQSTKNTENQESKDLTLKDANVESITVNKQESFPVQVSVTAEGKLRNGCEEIYDVSSRQQGNTFYVQLRSSQPKDKACTQVVRDFSETFPLDVQELSAGTYTVDVNGVTSTFTLEQDNTVEAQEGSVGK